MQPALQWFILIMLSFSFSVVSAKEQYTFQITDADGMPLEGAVIEPVSGSTINADSLPLAIIDQVNKRFNPQQILISEGQSVDFPNSDNIRHHVYSFSKAKAFELKLYADTPESPVQFNEHGVVVLGCNIHDTMIGYIFVSNSPETVMTDADGKATLISSKPLEQLHIWHKYQVIGPERLHELSLAELTLDEQGQYRYSIVTETPPPTESFEDTFGGISTAN